MKKTVSKFIALFALVALCAPFIALDAQEQEQKKEKEDFSAYMQTIGTMKKSIQENLSAYQEASKKIFPKEKEKSDGTIIVLSTYEKQFSGSFVPYFFREYVEVAGGNMKLFSEKTITDVVFESGKSLDKKQDDKKTDKTTLYTRQREISLSGDDADSITITYRSTMGSEVVHKFSELKKLRSKIEILSQIREQLMMTERVMDYTIHRSKLLQEALDEKSLIDFEVTR